MTLSLFGVRQSMADQIREAGLHAPKRFFGRGNRPELKQKQLPRKGRCGDYQPTVATFSVQSRQVVRQCHRLQHLKQMSKATQTWQTSELPCCQPCRTSSASPLQWKNSRMQSENKKSNTVKTRTSRFWLFPSNMRAGTPFPSDEARPAATDVGGPSRARGTANTYANKVEGPSAVRR